MPKISELTSTALPSGNDYFVLVRDTGNYKIPYSGLNNPTKAFSIPVFNFDEVVTSGLAKYYLHIISDINNYRVYTGGAHVYSASTSGKPTVNLYNVTKSGYLFSTNITIDVSGYDSVTASVPSVVNTGCQIVNTADVIRVDILNNGVGVTGIDVRASFIQY